MPDHIMHQIKVIGVVLLYFRDVCHEHITIISMLVTNKILHVLRNIDSACIHQ